MKKLIGELTESKIQTDLLERGYVVSVPWGDSGRYDLVAEKDGDFYRVQCKTALPRDNGSVEIHVTNYNPFMSEHSKYDSSEIDCFAVWAHNEAFYIHIKEIENYERCMTIRFSPTKNNQIVGVNWYEDYLKFPPVPP